MGTRSKMRGMTVHDATLRKKSWTLDDDDDDFDDALSRTASSNVNGVASA